jgi:hypothetical protein
MAFSGEPSFSYSASIAGDVGEETIGRVGGEGKMVPLLAALRLETQRSR